MTATTEKPVVSKQAHVVEEVALSKQSGQREETVSGTVRRQDVKVEEIDGKSGKSGMPKRLRLNAETSGASGSSVLRAYCPGSSSEPRHLFPRFI